MVYNNIIIVYNNMQYYNNIKTQPHTQRQRPSKWSWWLALGQAKGKRQGFCLGLPVGGGAEAIWPSSTVFPGTPVVNWIRGRTASLELALQYGMLESQTAVLTCCATTPAPLNYEMSQILIISIPQENSLYSKGEKWHT